jgi:pimeloyl-ACP methyl ester carboxylesterase
MIGNGRFVDVRGARTHYIDRGEGRPVILIHGGGPANCAELTWHAQVDRLAERFRVLALDTLGFGHTGLPDDGDSTLLARTRHAAAWCDGLDLEPAVVVGHSQGAFIATCIALERRARVRGLVIVSSGTTSPNGNFTLDGEFSPRVKEFIGFSSEPTFERALELWRRNSFFPERVDPDRMRQCYDQFIAAGHLDAYVHGTEKPLTADPRGFAGLYEEHIAPRLASLDMPTLLLWGRQDDFAYPERGLELARLMPDADVHLLSRSKHMLPSDRPEEFNTLVSAFCDR